MTLRFARKVTAVAIVAGVGLGIIAQPAGAEHQPSRSAYRAIVRVIAGPLPCSPAVPWVRISSRGPYALADVRSRSCPGSGDVQGGLVLLQGARHRWRVLIVISEEELACDEVPRSVFQDLRLNHYAVGGRCFGPYGAPSEPGVNATGGFARTISVTGSHADGYIVRLGHSVMPATIRAMVRRFGPPASEMQVGFRSDPECRLVWPRAEIIAVYYHGYGGLPTAGGPTNSSCNTYAQALHVTFGNGWRLVGGPRIGGGAASIASAYPAAVRRGSDWVLISDSTAFGTSVNVLVAEVHRGHITSFAVAGPESWDE